MTIKTVDKHTARELCLFIENDSGLYRQMYQPIVKNYAKKVVKKTYNRTLAVKGVVNLVREGARKYAKQHGSLGPISQATKEDAARQILSGMISEVRDEARKIRAKGH